MRDSEATRQMHAAQIYAEMLGQVCHKQLYNGNPSGFQEVKSRSKLCLSQSFVLHARHATFYIFYAKFPNTYLRDIARYGVEYKTLANNPHQVVIQQSKPFRMRQTKHQEEFFKLLSTMFYYMVCGKSNIGYLAENEWKYNVQVSPTLVVADI